MRLVSRNGIRVSRRRGDVKHKKPRLNQRRRTRAALVDAATQAVQRGETPPTIEDAAEAAGVSRATAHLYFTSQQSLLLKALLDVMGTIPDPSLVDEGPVESRVDAAIRSLVRMAYDHEPVLRTFRMLSLEQWLRTHQKSNENYPCAKAGG